MNFLTKKHLSRRTFLRGAGGTIALPLLESMIPAQGRAAAAVPKTRLAFVFFPHGVTMDKWIPAGIGDGLRVHADPPAARALPRVHQHRQQHLCADGLRRRCVGGREPCAIVRGLPVGRKTGRRGATGPRRDGRSGGGARDRPGHSAPVDRADRRTRRAREPLPQHDFLAHGDLAPAHGAQSAGHLREAVWRWRHRERARGAPEAGAKPARFGDGSGRPP